MLTIHTRDAKGYPLDVLWYCDNCEVEELQRRDLPPVRKGHPVTLPYGRGTETLIHSPTGIPPWCMGCEESPV